MQNPLCVSYPGGRPVAFNTFTCPNCKALYQLVKGEAGPESSLNDVPCHVCGVPINGRDGDFVLKYFLLRKAIRARQRA